jgi:hypothetical protein
MTDTKWFWKGKWLEYCSCDWGCPCESQAPPSRGHCDGVVAMHIDAGHYGDVKLDGITIVATFFFPRALHHGGGRMQPILPDWTTPEQRDAVFKVMSGEGQPPNTIFPIFHAVVETIHEGAEMILCLPRSAEVSPPARTNSRLCVVAVSRVTANGSRWIAWSPLTPPAEFEWCKIQ